MVAPSPNICMTNFNPVGINMQVPNKIDTAIGITVRLYVKSLGSSYAKYLEKLPDIVRTTTKVHMIQNGP